MGYLNLSIADFADICNLSVSTVKDLSNKGILNPIRTKGGHRRFVYDNILEAEKLGYIEHNKYHYGYIYLTENLINGKKYVGQRACILFDTNYIGSGKILKKAIEKYGRGNFKCSILEWGNSREALNELEVKWIEYYNADMSEDFYNISHGGNVPSMRGENNPRYGVELSDEIKGKIRQKVLGREVSEDTKVKISKSSKDRIFTEEHRKKIGDAQRGEKHRLYGKYISDEQKAKISKTLTGSIRPKCGNASRGKVWINNGEKEMYIFLEQGIPEGYVRGRVTKRSRETYEGKIKINNGERCFYIKECELEEYLKKGYKKGGLPRYITEEYYSRYDKYKLNNGDRWLDKVEGRGVTDKLE